MQNKVELVTEVARKMATQAARIRSRRPKVAARSKVPQDRAYACLCRPCAYNLQR